MGQSWEQPYKHQCLDMGGQEEEMLSELSYPSPQVWRHAVRSSSSDCQGQASHHTSPTAVQDEGL